MNTILGLPGFAADTDPGASKEAPTAAVVLRNDLRDMLLMLFSMRLTVAFGNLSDFVFHFLYIVNSEESNLIERHIVVPVVAGYLLPENNVPGTICSLFPDQVLELFG
jgi:hypothetical protein